MNLIRAVLLIKEGRGALVLGQGMGRGPTVGSPARSTRQSCVSSSRRKDFVPSEILVTSLMGMLK